MNILRIEVFIREHLGIDPGSLGSSVLPRAIEHRMRVRGLTTPDAYIGILASQPAEVEALAGELVVPESWFFRGGRSLFDRLVDFISTRAAAEPVRVLSIPCSTGEEPYSLAIALHEHLIAPERYRIVAVDLSASHLDRAAEGRYTSFAFREAGTDIRVPHFRQLPDRWELLPHLRRLVVFRAGNLIDPTFLVGESPFDVILCRNLFIYLTPDARRKAMANLDRLLMRDGWLCLTPGEADRLPAGQFVQEGPSELGIFRRVGIGSKVHAALNVAPAMAPASRSSAPVSVATPPPVISTPSVDPRTPTTLEMAHRLADAGRLAEARSSCEQILHDKSDSSDAYALLGTIHAAEGRAAEATEAFRRALYLSPNNIEALSHMIVLCEGRGDTMQATALRRRLARATRGEAT